MPSKRLFPSDKPEVKIRAYREGDAVVFTVVAGIHDVIKVAGGPRGSSGSVARGDEDHDQNDAWRIAKKLVGKEHLDRFDWLVVEAGSGDCWLDSEAMEGYPRYRMGVR